jgi:hypothetical protein
VTAGNDNAGLFRLFSATTQDRTGNLIRQVWWQGGDVERQEGRATHGVDVRETVSRGNGAIIVAIVHHRGEEVSGSNQHAFFVQLPDGGIIRAIETDQQVWIIGRIEDILYGAQNLRQRFRV